MAGWETGSRKGRGGPIHCRPAAPGPGSPANHAKAAVSPAPAWATVQRGSGWVGVSGRLWNRTQVSWRPAPCSSRQNSLPLLPCPSRPPRSPLRGCPDAPLDFNGPGCGVRQPRTSTRPFCSALYKREGPWRGNVSTVPPPRGASSTLSPTAESGCSPEQHLTWPLEITRLSTGWGVPKTCSSSTICTAEPITTPLCSQPSPGQRQRGTVRAAPGGRVLCP